VANINSSGPIKIWILLVFFLSLPLHSYAVDVSFPDEELPSETVTPQFDIPEAFVNPKIHYSHRFEVEVDAGNTLDEVFYNGSFLSFEAAYSWSQENSLGLKVSQWGTGLSNYGNQLGSVTGREGKPLNFNLGQGPTQYFGLVYKDRLFYGKVSFSKSIAMPLSMAVIYEVGDIQYATQNLPLIGAGFTNQLYFNSHWSIDAKFKLIVNQYVDPVSVDLNATPAPTLSTFSIKTALHSQIEVGVGFLF